MGIPFGASDPQAGAGSSGLARRPPGSHTEHGTSREEGTEPGREQQGQAPLHDSASLALGPSLP